MDIIFIIGRIVVGLFFINSGVMHFLKWDNMVGYSKSKNIPLPAVAVGVTGLMMIAGGLGLVFWKFVGIAALLLAVFLVPAAFLMHAFWKEQDQAQKGAEMINFLKNIALAGALGIIAAMYYQMGGM